MDSRTVDQLVICHGQQRVSSPQPATIRLTIQHWRPMGELRLSRNCDRIPGLFDFPITRAGGEVKWIIAHERRR